LKNSYIQFARVSQGIKIRGYGWDWSTNGCYWGRVRRRRNQWGPFKGLYLVEKKLTTGGEVVWQKFSQTLKRKVGW